MWLCTRYHFRARNHTTGTVNEFIINTKNGAFEFGDTAAKGAALHALAETCVCIHAYGSFPVVLHLTLLVTKMFDTAQVRGRSLLVLQPYSGHCRPLG